MSIDTQEQIVTSLPVEGSEKLKLPEIKTCYLGTEVIDPYDRYYVHTGIINLPDQDGQKIYLPVFQEDTYAGSTMPLPEPNPISLTTDQVHRLKFANEANLCPLVATHLALNTDLPSSEFATFSHSNEAPGIISYYGLPNSLKSKLIALVHYNTHLPVFSFDSFSTRDLNSYLEIINQLPSNLSLDQQLDAIKSVDSKKSPQKLSLRATIDNFIEFTQQNPDSLYLIDLPGNDFTRDLDIFDFTAFWALNSTIVYREPDDSELSTIRAYANEMVMAIWMGATVSAWSKNLAFKNQIAAL